MVNTDGTYLRTVLIDGEGLAVLRRAVTLHYLIAQNHRTSVTHLGLLVSYRLGHVAVCLAIDVVDTIRQNQRLGRDSLLTILTIGG